MRTRHQRIRRTRDEAVLRPPTRPARPPLPSRPYFPERQVRAALRRSRPSAMPGAAQQHVLRELAENPQPLPRRARLRGRRVDEPVHRKVTHRTAPGPAGGLTALVRTAARPHGRTAARLRRDRLAHICAGTLGRTARRGSASRARNGRRRDRRARRRSRRTGPSRTAPIGAVRHSARTLSAGASLRRVDARARVSAREHVECACTYV